MINRKWDNAVPGGLNSSLLVILSTTKKRVFIRTYRKIVPKMFLLFLKLKSHYAVTRREMHVI